MNTALITGGAGFIGSNLADYLLQDKWNVVVFDNISRAGVDNNLDWLKSKHKTSSLKIQIKDIRDFEAVKKAVKKADVVYHLAGQVAVTTSYLYPREDFDINLTGSLNVLEAARLSGHKPIIIYASTNKVYGGLEDIKLRELKSRYAFSSKFAQGISEKYPVDFHSPYGCSKGGADQYTRDYYRMYGIPTIVFRQSCIYGPHQMGAVDQGWVAYLAMNALAGDPITIFGDGKQVRYLLHVSDLIHAYQLAIKNIKKTQGQIYNTGGGLKHTFSILEYLNFLEEFGGKKIKRVFKDPRPGDQKIYISDIRKIAEELHWKPEICHKQGLELLYTWIKENEELF